MSTMIRQSLEKLYQGSGVLAAVFLVAICLMVLLQVGANLIDRMAGLILGEAIGITIPSYSDFTGFFLAASSFLALAYTLRGGGHIRVTLIVSHLHGRAARIVELIVIGFAATLSGFFAYNTINLVAESLEFNDLSPGMVAVPIWIPQLPMALGLIVLTIALVDDLVQLLRGEDPSYKSHHDGLISETDGTADSVMDAE